MTAARRQQIRRLAAERAARELDAAIGWEAPALYDLDPEETEEFNGEIRRIVADLRKRAAA